MPFSLITKFKIFLLYCLLCSNSSYAQYALRNIASNPQTADSVDIQHYSQRDFVHAASLVTGLNVSVWVFDRYVLGAEYSKVNLNTMKANIKHGFVWDNDMIGTNVFMHPYHGSLYFNSARANGFNYFESAAFAFGGSLTWELFAENEYPSMNDIIATPIGGSILGEVFHRASDLVLDDRKTGSERFFREAASFLMAPTNGLSRMLNGNMWRQRSTSGRFFGIPETSIEVSAGLRTLQMKGKIYDAGVGFATGVKIEYGEPYEADNECIFDYFTLRGILNFQSGQPLLGKLHVMGRLYASEIIDNTKDYVSMGIYQHFDYYDSDTINGISNIIPYRFGTPASIGIGFMHKSRRSDNWHFSSSLHLNTMLLGASLSDHYQVDHRNYNLGSGFSVKLGASLSYQNRVALSWWHDRFNLYTWKGYPEGFDFTTIDETNSKDINYQGDKSRSILNFSNFRLDIKLKEKLYFTGLFSIYRRSTKYSYFEDVNSWSSDSKLGLTYKF